MAHCRMDVRLLSRKTVIGVILALAAVIFLASLSYQPFRSRTLAVLRGDVYSNIVTSTYELDYLPESIAMNIPACTDDKRAADLVKSRIAIHNPKSIYPLGDIINVNIQLFDGYGKPITRGGAVIRPRIVNLAKKAYSAAPVKDHGNGTYTARFEALWTGNSTITAKIAYVPETIRANYNLRRVLRSTVEINGTFSVGNISETTLCHPTKKALDNVYSQICNLTYDNSGMPWFCGKPKNIHLLCEDWTGSHTHVPFPVLPWTPCEKKLLGRSSKDMYTSIKVHVEQGTEPGSIIRLPTIPCKHFDATQLWSLKQTSGFMYENKWHLRHCKGQSEKSLFSCLQNKKVLLFGDSTVRHWYIHIMKQLNCLPKTEKWTIENWKRRTACANTEHNFTIQWLPHSHPYNGVDTNRYTRASIARHLEETGNDERVIALMHMFLHLVPYHPSVFREKMRRIRTSVEHLLDRNKFVKILIKGPHTFYSYLERYSDFFGLAYKHIMYEEFQGLHDKIIYLDQKDCTDALALVDNHPPPKVIAEMLGQMLSYLC